MILPIYAYGQAVLKKVGKPIDANYDGLTELIDNMWETMYNAQGVGLAAPQIGKSIRLFLVDTVQLNSDNRNLNNQNLDNRNLDNRNSDNRKSDNRNSDN